MVIMQNISIKQTSNDKYTVFLREGLTPIQSWQVGVTEFKALMREKVTNFNSKLPKKLNDEFNINETALIQTILDVVKNSPKEPVPAIYLSPTAGKEFSSVQRVLSRLQNVKGTSDAFEFFVSKQEGSANDAILLKKYDDMMKSVTPIDKKEIVKTAAFITSELQQRYRVDSKNYYKIDNPDLTDLNLAIDLINNGIVASKINEGPHILAYLQNQLRQTNPPLPEGSVVRTVLALVNMRHKGKVNSNASTSEETEVTCSKGFKTMTAHLALDLNVLAQTTTVVDKSDTSAFSKSIEEIMAELLNTVFLKVGVERRLGDALPGRSLFMLIKQVNSINPQCTEAEFQTRLNEVVLSSQNDLNFVRNLFNFQFTGDDLSELDPDELDALKAFALNCKPILADFYTELEKGIDLLTSNEATYTKLLQKFGAKEFPENTDIKKVLEQVFIGYFRDSASFDNLLSRTLITNKWISNESREVLAVLNALNESTPNTPPKNSSPGFFKATAPGMSKELIDKMAVNILFVFKNKYPEKHDLEDVDKVEEIKAKLKTATEQVFQKFNGSRSIESREIQEYVKGILTSEPAASFINK